MKKKLPEIRLAIDACRPGSDDLYQEEFTELAEALREDISQDDPQIQQWYEQTQRLDASLVEAFHDVQVPDDLADRLLAALPTADDAVTPSSISTPAITKKSSRRRWLVSLTGGVLALVVTILGYTLLLPATPLSQVTVLQQAMQWTLELHQPSDDWKRDLQQASASHRFDPGTLQQYPQRWRQLETSLDRQTVVYDLASSGTQPIAVLFVIHLDRGTTTDLPSSPPASPPSQTGGWSLGAWQQGRTLYVLAVQGDRLRYSHFVKPSILG